MSQLLMGFQYVAFLPSRASFFSTFLKNCDGVVSLGTTTYHKTVVGVSKGMLPVKYFRPNKASSFCQSNFMEIIRLSISLHVTGLSVLRLLPNLEQSV